MPLTGGRRLGTYLRAPSGTPISYVPRVSDTGDIIEWVSLNAIGAGMVPTYIAPTETFTVPANRQTTFAMLIDNEGTLDVEGFLIEVD